MAPLYHEYDYNYDIICGENCWGKIGGGSYTFDIHVVHVCVCV